MESCDEAPKEFEKTVVVVCRAPKMLLPTKQGALDVDIRLDVEAVKR